MKIKQETAETSLKETSRLEAFSDAVFAIAITLLILELTQLLHIKTGEGLEKLLLGHLNSFLAFGIGFIAVLICWINHHLVFSHIKKTNENLVWINGFILLMVSFTPFPTSILAEYFSTEPHLAIAVFGFNFLLMSIAAYIITAYVYNNRMIEENSRNLFYRLKVLYKFSIVFTGVSLFIGMVSVPAAIILYCFLFTVFAFPKKAMSILVYMKRKNLPLKLHPYKI